MPTSHGTNNFFLFAKQHAIGHYNEAQGPSPHPHALSKISVSNG